MRQKGFVPIIFIFIAVVGLIIAGVITLSFFQKTKIIPFKPPVGEVTVTIDKTEYMQGEDVEITARNGLNQPIYHRGDWCEPHNFIPERLEDQTWESVGKIYCIVLGAKSESISSEVPPIENPLQRLLKKIFGDKPKGTKLAPNEQIDETWHPLQRTSLDGTTFIEPGTYRISFPYGLTETTFSEITVYSGEFTIKKKDYSQSGQIIDLNLLVYRDNKVVEAEPIRITTGRPTSSFILENQEEGDYVLEIDSKAAGPTTGTILWTHSFPIYFDYTGPVEEGVDYSDIEYDSQLVSFKIPYDPEMKALRLWYLKATVDWSKTKEPKIIFFKKLPSFNNFQGKVMGNQGSPVEKADVELYQGEKDAGNTYTNENGEYFFSQIKPGEYRIIVRPPASQNVLIGDKKNIIVSADEVTTVDFALQPCGSIGGKITDARGNPIAEAWAQIVGSETPRYHVDEDGNYAIPYLKPGNYQVAADAEISGKHIDLTPKTVTVELGKTGNLDFVFAE